MATAKQLLGAWGEKLVAAKCACPKCKRSKTLKLLPPNFKCADLICDFCGFLAQVKAMSVPAVSPLPNKYLVPHGGHRRNAWTPASTFLFFWPSKLQPVKLSTTCRWTSRAPLSFLLANHFPPQLGVLAGRASCMFLGQYRKGRLFVCCSALTTHSSGRRSIACASYKRCGAGAAKFRR